MLHCDDDDLSLIALGEPGSASDEEHLRQCPRCQSRLDQLVAVASSARAITDDDRPREAPASVWTAITAELGIEAAGNVTSLSSVRSRRGPGKWLYVGVAAAAGLIAGSLVTLGLTSSTGGADVMARASLSPVAGSGFAGVATVERSAGAAVLHVDVPDLPSVADGYYEVWMATSDAATMVALGTLSPGQEGTFTLPAGLDAAEFPLVDVSIEHFDGDAAHSAVSVVRGELGA